MSIHVTPASTCGCERNCETFMYISNNNKNVDYQYGWRKLLTLTNCRAGHKLIDGYPPEEHIHNLTATLLMSRRGASPCEYDY